MIDITIERRDVNPALLHEELAAMLGPRLVGVSHDGSILRVHVLDSTTAEEEVVVKNIVARHDATRLTDAQRADRDRRIALESLRNKPWEAWTAADKDVLLRMLAEQLLSSTPPE